MTDLIEKLIGPKGSPPLELDLLIEKGDRSNIEEWLEANSSQFLTWEEHPRSPVESLTEVHNLLRWTSPIRLSPYAVGGVNNYIGVLLIVFKKLKGKDIPRDYQLRKLTAQVLINLGIEIRRSHGGRRGLKRHKVNRAFLDVLSSLSPESSFFELERRLLRSGKVGELIDLYRRMDDGQN